ncbi:DUF4868 domain-containing protein [Brucella sp. BO3]|uniref:Kiwa anti-phage protein KwaB-like domain-containing protein n=1 Tax=unclassified Brucella TaxID=2632610 RepID=UPI00084FAC6D|nr:MULTISPECIES: Kiwa anti-phage protein KwaB-like domain-containing protein [unclassified Brucella]OEI84671.1 hypothetical protein BA060_02255 [Brucella sp. B13-0095]QMV26690.1 DUF4868 domain-containing protein [Brucella sp. BO3]
MTELANLKAFNVKEADLTLWTFKGTVPQINGHWIETTDELDQELKRVFLSQLNGFSEEQNYSLLAQNNEESVMTLPSDETDVYVISEAIGQITSGRKTQSVKTLRNAKFYVVRFVHNGQVVFAVRKTDPSWKTKAATNVLTAIYKDRELDLAEDDGFKIQRTFDFFCINDQLLISDKRNFETILNYRAAHENDFEQLQAEAEFIQVFAELTHLRSFVGINRLQLRRMSAIRVKSFYKDEGFMNNLRLRYAEFGLNIVFDGEGKIIPTPETCRDIMTALLDHRLRSGFSGNTYDVPDAVQV